jgi:hypothetical protein
LESGINRDTPHFEGGKCRREASLERHHLLALGLFDVDQVEDVAQRVDCPRWVEVSLDVVDSLKAFTVELRFADEEIGDGRLAVKCENLFPPATGRRIVGRCDECSLGAGPVRGPAETGINDLPGGDPGFLVLDGLNA